MLSDVMRTEIKVKLKSQENKKFFRKTRNFLFRTVTKDISNYNKINSVDYNKINTIEITLRLKLKIGPLVLGK